MTPRALVLVVALALAGACGPDAIGVEGDDTGGPECSPGSVTCPCLPSGECAEGSCMSGVDEDGAHWSMCFPADLIRCEEDDGCFAGTYCTDSGVCAWAD